MVSMKGLVNAETEVGNKLFRVFLLYDYYTRVMLLVLYPSFISLLAFNLLGEFFGFCPSLIREVEELERGHAFCSYVILFFVQCRPSTFAQAAKLRRMAAAKEKELANCIICNCSY